MKRKREEIGLWFCGGITRITWTKLMRMLLGKTKQIDTYDFNDQVKSSRTQ